MQPATMAKLEIIPDNRSRTRIPNFRGRVDSALPRRKAPDNLILIRMFQLLFRTCWWGKMNGKIFRISSNSHLKQFVTLSSLREAQSENLRDNFSWKHPKLRCKPILLSRQMSQMFQGPLLICKWIWIKNYHLKTSKCILKKELQKTTFNICWAIKYHSKNSQES